MTRSPRHFAAPAKLSESVHKRLNMYTLAASAAGVSWLAFAQLAEARIVYTPIYRVIPPHHSYSIDLNHDGITDFTIANSVSACTDFCFFELRQLPADGNKAAGYFLGSGSGFPADSALHPGSSIGPGSPFKKGTAALVVARANQFSSHQTIVYGPWVKVADRYLGLQFQIEGETHYGWARLNVGVRGTTIVAALTGYAYETTPNKPIIAGETLGTDGGVEGSNAPLNVPTPQPAALCVLALGSSGLSIWRREGL